MCAGRGAVKVTIASALRHRAHLFAHDVGVGAGRNVHRDHGRGTRIHRGDRFGVQPAHRRAEAGAEDGIDQNISIENRAGGFSLQLFLRTDVTGATGSLVNISAASPRSSDGSANSSTRTSLPACMQLAGGYESVSAVISFAANHANVFRRGILRRTKSATAAPAFSMSVSEERRSARW